MTNYSHENIGNNVGNKLLVSYYCLKKKQLSYNYLLSKFNKFFLYKWIFIRCGRQ